MDKGAMAGRMGEGGWAGGRVAGRRDGKWRGCGGVGLGVVCACGVWGDELAGWGWYGKGGRTAHSCFEHTTRERRRYPRDDRAPACER